MEHEERNASAGRSRGLPALGTLAVVVGWMALALVPSSGCSESSSHGVAAVSSPTVPASLQGINLVDFHLNFAQAYAVAPVASASITPVLTSTSTAAAASPGTPLNLSPPTTTTSSQAAARTNELCLTCHGAMLDRQSLDPLNTPEFHKFKLDPASGVLKGWKCIDCHVRVDLAARSGGSLRKQVNAAAICYPCHLQAGVGKKLYVK